jgi:hypothetical protein
MTYHWRSLVGNVRTKENPLGRHAKHACEVKPGVGPHVARLYCVKCRKHVIWLSKSDYDIWQKMDK